MDNAPKVSILVPVCNTALYLRECLDSLVIQTLDEIQIICIDDGSTDSSPEILKEYAAKDARIEVITKPNSGYGDSMNIGLSRAKGEYVGIVESDDFAEHVMFKELYDIAILNNADVVKSRPFHHLSHWNPADDVVVDTVCNCRLDVLFNPLEDQAVFMTAPAIWSAIYRRGFLAENDIEFLPTPGASFQDTSFHFKAFAAAERAYISSNAYLHYRIDNANSSVKSQKKVFCICDEYKEIWRFAEEDPKRFEALKYRIPEVLFQGFLWNLDRLVEPLQYEFYGALVKELQKSNEQGLLKADYFDEDSWNKVSAIVSDPDHYFVKHYGPIRVESTTVVRFSGVGRCSVASFLDRLEDTIGPNDEVIAYVVEDDGQGESAIKDKRAHDARFFCADNLFVSKELELVDSSRLRGKETILINVEAIPGEVTDAKGFATQYLIDEHAPLFLPLLFSALYGSRDGDSSNIKPCMQYASLEQGDISLNEFQHARIAWDSVVVKLDRFFGGNGYEQRKRVYEFIKPVWPLLRMAYDALTFDERIRAGSAPSSACLSSLSPDCSHVNSEKNDSAQAGTPEISVIIPVYNVKKYIRECLDSVLAQDVGLEVICIDDGSTDGSWGVLEEYASADERVSIACQPNSGAAAARNRGISLARGRYLSFIDPDDYYPDASTLSRLLKAAQRESALMCAGSLVLVDEGGNPNEYAIRRDAFYTFTKEGFRDFSEYNEDYGWIRFLYDRALFDDYLLRFPEILHYEDPVFFLRAAKAAARFYALPEPVYCYRVGYKERSWPESHARDLLWGIQENLGITQELGWDALYSKIVSRLDGEFYDAIHRNRNDEEVIFRLAQIQSSLDFGRIDYIREKGERFYLLRALRYDEAEDCDLALTRLAKKMERTKVYGALQSVVRRLRQKRS